MQTRSRTSTGAGLLGIALLLLAAAGPLFHLAAITRRGVGLLYSDPRRLVVAYALLAVSAAAGAYLLLRSAPTILRILGAAALLANLVSVAYIGTAWSREMRLAFRNLEPTQIEPGKIGILVCPIDHSTEALDASQTLEDAISNLVARAEQSTYIVVRPGVSVHSVEEARHLGRDAKANVVVWVLSDRRAGAVYPQITVLGANETKIELVPDSLMLLMLTQDTLTFPASLNVRTPEAQQILASLSAGFAFMAVGQPMQAATQFRNVIDSDALPQEMRAKLQRHFATTLLFVDRLDLAGPAYQAANELAPSSPAWVGLGLVSLRDRDWRGAQFAFNQAVALDPYDPGGYCGQGILLARDRSISQSISAYRQAVALDELGPVPYALLGLAHELEANIAGAREAYRKSALYAGPNVGLQIAVLERSDKIVRNPPTAIPTATPIPIPTHTPIPTAALYRVAKGDTLQVLADEFGVEISAIVELNKLANPNSLSVGQMLQIPRKPEE